MKLHEKLFKLRKENGMTQDDLAEKLDISRQAISRWEMGTALPDVINILHLSKLYGVSTDYLLNDEYESDSDLPIVQKAVDMLKSLEIPYEVHIYSAHRTPVEARDFAVNARQNESNALQLNI